MPSVCPFVELPSPRILSLLSISFLGASQDASGRLHYGIPAPRRGTLLSWSLIEIGCSIWCWIVTFFDRSGSILNKSSRTQVCSGPIYHACVWCLVTSTVVQCRSVFPESHSILFATSVVIPTPWDSAAAQGWKSWCWSPSMPQFWSTTVCTGSYTSCIQIHTQCHSQQVYWLW